MDTISDLIYGMSNIDGATFEYCSSLGVWTWDMPWQ